MRKVGAVARAGGRGTFFRVVVIACLLAAIGLGSETAQAADKPNYKAEVDKTGNSALDDAIHQTSLLVQLRKSAPLDPFALVARANEDIPRIQAALASYGYYQATVGVKIDQRDISDPNLLTFLDTVPKGQRIWVHVVIATGPLYHLRHIAISGEVPKDAADRLKLHEGDPAVAADVLAGGTRLLTGLEEDGYALAKVDQPSAVADDQAHVVDVTFNVVTGPKADIGAITITGLHDVHEPVVQTAIGIKPGDLYRPSKIEESRKSVLALGVFSGAEARASDKLDAAGRVPLNFDVTERPRHAVSFTAAYSTDLGFSAGATWSDRNLFGNAEQLNLSAAINGVGGTASSTLGYNATAQFIKPEFYARDQTLEIDVGGIKQKLDAYDQTAETVAGLVHRRFSALWSGSVGLSLEHDNILQESVKRTYELLSVPFTVKYDSTGVEGALQEATHGVRLLFAATPTQSFRHSATFVSLEVGGSGYFDLANLGIEKPTEGVIAVRALAEAVEGASVFDLPPDRRLYAGGSDTVRGYRYQSIGPRFPDGTPTGATAVDAGTVEFRQHLFDEFGAAAFIDVGQASAAGVPFNGTLRAGAGLGVRYYSPIGPVRVDVAVPLTPIKGGDAFEIYIGLGQAF
ncbi:MAG: BamA/TamA family outer membrane protein [Alphaproteobacteria bacterium]|nr:BamA/TamA family outer membrane protein [Alphaproteobacteria bacterium]